MLNKLIVIPIFLLLIGCQPNKEKNKTSSSFENSSKYYMIDSLLNTCFKRGLLNGNVAIITEEGLIYNKSFGYINGLKKQKLNSNSLFNIGSISKEFSAVAIMKLIEDGQLNLDDKISNFSLGYGSWSSTITIQNLLDYRSGLPSLDWDKIRTDDDIHQNLLSLKKLEFEPGTSFDYSDYNIFLRKCIIEKTSEIPYDEYINKYLLIPNSLTKTKLGSDGNYTNLAKAFNNKFIDDQHINFKISDWVFSTSSDMVLWLQALHKEKLISKKSIDTLFKSLTPSQNNQQSALGIGIYENGILKEHRHNGSSYNYESTIYYNSISSLGVALLTNNKNFKLEEIANAINNIYSDQKFEIPKKSVYLSIREKCYANIDEGLNYYNELKEKFPEEYNFENKEELMQVGFKLIEQEKFQSSIKLFDFVKIEFQDLKNIFIHLGLAESYYGMENKRQALKHYKVIAEIKENNNYLDYAKNRIKELK